jgi:hypothetical protein
MNENCSRYLVRTTQIGMQERCTRMLSSITHLPCLHRMLHVLPALVAIRDHTLSSTYMESLDTRMVSSQLQYLRSWIESARLPRFWRAAAICAGSESIPHILDSQVIYMSGGIRWQRVCCCHCKWILNWLRCRWSLQIWMTIADRVVGFSTGRCDSPYVCLFAKFTHSHWLFILLLIADNDRMKS